MLRWLRNLAGARATRRTELPDALWQQTLEHYPFLRQAEPVHAHALRRLTLEFLDHKEFHGANGLRITDAMAVAIAAQACLPVLHLRAPLAGIAWYDDFVGIVVHPGSVVARREHVDDAGIVHRYDEVLSGEAMQDGPVMLSWQDVADAGTSARDGYNVVIHEFVHKIDMRDGMPDGCPPLPAGFMGAGSAKAARAAWQAALEHHYLAFRDQLSLAERFGAAEPWLDPYAATSPDEFFAVASEAYFVNRARFVADFDGLRPMFDAFFKPAAPAG
ncbi:MAG: zinc-dependent peptidase [Rhodoferax sp.]|nr:zinc-dependent peptidase [Rhodoferax sp.]MCB2005365.1 zinc-dependent peptidase [Rhodoferax sp.]MCB2027599.1 zinc-dependent peptidase [Rhodoferax sp.]MCP5262463.1 zinc-dependent peptidase [Rhodoferax sp.]MCW5629244.1 zinc-dependent peptidase [Rhodoferax sp.]